VKESHHSLDSPNKLGFEVGSSFDQLRCRSLSHSCIEEERDENDADFPFIPNIAKYLHYEFKDTGHDYLIADSRDPGDDEIHIQRDERSNDDGERTAAHPVANEMLTIARRSSTEDDRFPQEFLNNGTSGLKRANPIYESESEAEHNVEISVQARKRRSLGGGQVVGPTPLYWNERLSVE